MRKISTIIALKCGEKKSKLIIHTRYLFTYIPGRYI